VSGSPIVRQKLGDATNWMAGNASEYVFEPSESIDVSALARSNEAAQYCGRPSADIAPEKHPVAATYGYATNSALGPVIVDFQIPVF
jgi:hypothetical protein